MFTKWKRLGPRRPPFCSGDFRKRGIRRTRADTGGSCGERTGVLAADRNPRTGPSGVRAGRRGRGRDLHPRARPRPIPDWFGIASRPSTATSSRSATRGLPFTIQSISKPFVFGMALEDRGDDAVLARVGVEPSGNAVQLDRRSTPSSNRPFNPMVNAGAIVDDRAHRGRRRRATASSGSSRRFGASRAASSRIDEAVFASERDDRRPQPRASRYLMRSFGMLDGDVDEVVDLYFGQCSILVDLPRSRGDGARPSRTAASTRSPANARSARSTSRTCSAS